MAKPVKVSAFHPFIAKRLFGDSGDQISTNFLSLADLSTTRCNWGVQDSNLRRLSQQIYSLSRLTASVTPLANPRDSLKSLLLNSLAKKQRASGGSRTHDLLITNQLLCQLSYAGRNRKRDKYIEFGWSRNTK